MTLRPGAQIDDWTLMSRLGRGGNGEVWRAVHPEHGENALKVLARKSHDRWQRFCDEVSIMQRLADRPGILPLVAAELPPAQSRAVAWLATPIAERLVDALGPSPSLVAVVEAVHQFARTLSGLSAEGVFHRDIKPDNLFRYGGRWALGDFGLVTYPEKEAITVGNRRLGPLYFIAPEMLRHPATADPAPADVYSLAKTLWVLATGQRYPPEGQVRVDVPSHDLAEWVSAPGTVALGLLLQSATDESPPGRPTMAEFTDQLHQWTKGDPTQDDRAADAIRRDYVKSLSEELAKSVDPEAFRTIEAELREALADARRRSADKRQELLRDAMEQSESSRRTLIDDYGIKAALDLHDSPWIGALRDGEDFVYAVLSCDAAERQAQLIRARQILWGRPLWWMHSVALTGSLRLRGEDGCEPLATELATREIRYHLLEFADHPTLAAAWRLQGALIPAFARIAAYGPLDDLSRSMASRMSAEQRVRYSPSPGRAMMQIVRNLVRSRLREVDWTPSSLNAAAEEAESALERIPIPAAQWDGPLTDPWLQSWSQYSPLVMCGLTILNADPSADDLLTATELRQVITDAAESEFQVLRRPAVPLAARLGLGD
ncbi:MAG: protein kinase domain-containing protein [Thermoleophilaceae bacterium]